MKHLLIPIAAALVLAGCSPSAPPDSVEALAVNLARLKELRAQCKADHEKLGDVLCNRVAQATRRRFMGEGQSPYANDPVSKDGAP
ncbi:EexN family lipoprotein [Ramlibacter sp. 2FC]|uniref:EexN family lipoprotein n=1 Tax=Ramlibacter sp. 2FC TaxID=2502188 RepID=UPI0010F8F8DA|nr:EexN family lipoprotein [Ramlibacter sp. 2FC]